MLTHLEPQRSEKWENNAKSTKHRKTRRFFGGPGVSLARGRRPLSPTDGEERNAYGYATARGPLAGFRRLRATAGQGAQLCGPIFVAMLAYVGLCWAYVGLCWPIVRAIPAFLHCQLPPCSCPPGAGFRSAQPRSKLESKDPVAGLKHHGSEPRITPAGP